MPLRNRFSHLPISRCCDLHAGHPFLIVAAIGALHAQTLAYASDASIRLCSWHVVYVLAGLTLFLEFVF